MTWNVYLKADTRQGALQAVADHPHVKSGACSTDVVDLITKMVMLLPEPIPRPPDPPIPRGSVAGPAPAPFFPREVEITANGDFSFVANESGGTGPAHATIMVSLVPGGVKVIGPDGKPK